MPRYDLLLFDFDGTLADSFDWFWHALPEIVARYRLRPLDPAQREAYRALSARALMVRLGVRWWQLPWIARYARAQIQAQIHTIAPFAGVPALLRELRAANVRCAVLSSNSEANIRHVLGAELCASLHAIAGGAPILGKRRRTRRLLRRAGVAPARVLSVGDELRDAEAAQALGIDFLPVAWGYTAPQAFVAAGWGEPVATPAEIVQRVLGSSMAPVAVR